MINEISLVGVRMFNFIDNRLRSIEYIQKSGLDLIRIGDFLSNTLYEKLSRIMLMH
jgi:hypothetical protein